MDSRRDLLSIESKITLIILTIIVLYWSWYFVIKPIKDQYDVRVGDIYLDSFSEENPFNKKKFKYYRVIDKKGKFVKFIDLETNDTITMKTRLFLYESEKIEP